MVEEVKEPALRELQEELSNLKSLQQHFGYKYLMELAEAQEKSRTGQILLTPLKTMDEVLAQEYMKGEVSGIMLFRNLVTVRVEDLEEQIKDELAVLDQQSGVKKDEREDTDFGL